MAYRKIRGGWKRERKKKQRGGDVWKFLKERRNAVSFFSNIEKKEKEGEDRQATKSCFNLLTN